MLNKGIKYIYRVPHVAKYNKSMGIISEYTQGDMHICGWNLSIKNAVEITKYAIKYENTAMTDPLPLGLFLKFEAYIYFKVWQ